MRRSVLVFTFAPLAALAIAGCASRSVSPPPAATTSPAGTVVSTAPATPAVAATAGSRIAELVASRPAGSTIVVLVRHAEKGTAPANDPPLSAEGTARAQALAAVLADVPVTAIVVTPTQRTNATAAFVAQARNLTPEPVGFGTGIPGHIEAVASAIRRHAGGVVLVVGHSNTVPRIIDELGGPRMPDLCESQYAKLYVLKMPAGSDASMLVHDTYGAADRADADGCAMMKQ